jgi:hypothetical protein
MDKEIGMNNEREVVIRILGLPPERIDYLHINCGMPFDEEGFSAWFVANAALILQELKENHERLLFPREFRPEPAEAAA